MGQEHEGGGWGALARGLLESLGDDVAGQGHPRWVQVFAGAGVGDDFDLRFSSDPTGFFGHRAPERCLALGVVATAKVHAEDSRIESSIPLRPGTTAGARLCCVVARDGQVGWRMVLPGGAPVDETPTEGRLLDCLKRALGLPTPPPPVEAGRLQSIMWLASILERALQSDHVLTWREVAGLHPVAEILTLHGDDFRPADLPDLARAASKVWSWERLRLAAERREWTLDAVEPDIAGWMDEGMFARWLLGELPGADELITRIRPLVTPSTARRLSHAVRTAA